MKVSDLIQEIVKLAEDKFGVSKHGNDVISVYINSQPGWNWEVGLERPSQRQLDSGEVDDVESIKLWEVRNAFDTEHKTLVGALKLLRQKVQDANSWDFTSEVSDSR
jgi:hypothetical protein